MKKRLTHYDEKSVSLMLPCGPRTVKDFKMREIRNNLQTDLEVSRVREYSSNESRVSY